MKIVAISDVHGFHEDIEIPDGDVLICAGDMLRAGTQHELNQLNEWLRKQPHQDKIYVAGNHDWCFQTHKEESKQILTNAMYLEDSGLEIQGQLFWGSPWTMRFGNWAFMLNSEAQLIRKWELIPPFVNVLITHSPPMGILDEALVIASNMTQYSQSVGSQTLRRKVDATNGLQAHIFGHIHNAYGQEPPFYNVSVCDEKYEPVNAATVIEL